MILGSAEAAIAGKFVEAAAIYAGHPVALQLRAMNIIGGRIARGDRGGAQFRIHHIGRRHMHLERAVAAVIDAFAEPARLRALEVRQHTGIVPVVQAISRPIVIVETMATRVNHAVDGGRTAERSAPGNLDTSAIQMGFRLTDEVPVQIPAQHVARKPDRHVLEKSRSGTTGFEQQYANALLFAQTIRKYAAGRTRADDDVVMGTGRHQPPALG